MVQSWSTNQFQPLLNTLLIAIRVAYSQLVTAELFTEATLESKGVIHCVTRLVRSRNAPTDFGIRMRKSTRKVIAKAEIASLFSPTKMSTKLLT